MNWRTDVVIAGTLRWNNYTDPPFDPDLTFELRSDAKSAALLHDNHGTYHVEFSGEETLRRMTHGWWGKVAKAVYAVEDTIRKYANYTDVLQRRRRADRTRQQALRTKFDGKYAVVLGRFGVDVQHGLRVEIHPVYAMAVRLSATHDPKRGRLVEEWAVLMRNWATQGYCSHGFHRPLARRDTVSILLPWVSGALQGAANSAQLQVPATGPSSATASVYPSKGIQITYALPATSPKVARSKRPILYGTLSLAWSLPSNVASDTDPNTGEGTVVRSLQSSEDSRWSGISDVDRLRLHIEEMKGESEAQREMAPMKSLEQIVHQPRSMTQDRPLGDIRAEVDADTEARSRRSFDALCLVSAKGSLLTICAATGRKRAEAVDSVVGSVRARYRLPD